MHSGAPWALDWPSLAPWALMGRALMGPPGPSWARPLWAGSLWAPLGPCRPPWALVAPLSPHGPGPCCLPGPLRAKPLWATLGPYGPGPCGPPLGPCGSGPCGPSGSPWALMCRVLIGFLGPHGPDPNVPHGPTLCAKAGGPSLTYFLSIMPMIKCNIYIYVYVHIPGETIRARPTRALGEPTMVRPIIAQGGPQWPAHKGPREQAPLGPCGFPWALVGPPGPCGPP